MKPVLDVRFFCTDAGKEPVREWLKGLPAIERKAIGEDIKTVQFGWPLGMPLVSHLGGDIWEVRIRLSNRIARVLFALGGKPWCYCMVSSNSNRRHQVPTWIWLGTG